MTVDNSHIVRSGVFSSRTTASVGADGAVDSPCWSTRRRTRPGNTKTGSSD